MSKRVINVKQSEVPSKYVKVEEVVSSASGQSTTSDIVKIVEKSEKVQEVLSSASNQSTKSDIVKIVEKSETLQSKNITSEEVPTQSTSSTSLTDRYSFNFWNDPENDDDRNKEKHEQLKIENLIIGKFERQSVIIRITYKSEIKDTKFGKVVSFLGMDETGEIAIVCFGKIGLQLHKEWEQNRVYSIANFTVQEENVNYPSGSNNALQIKTNSNFSYKSIDDVNIVPRISFSFKSIDEIKSIKNNSRVDLIGILVKDYGLETNSNNVSLRDLCITDNKKGMIIATLWGTAAEKFKSTNEIPIAIRKGIVGEFQEKKKINCTTGTLVWLNPLIPETSPLLKWFQESTNKKTL